MRPLIVSIGIARVHGNLGVSSKLTVPVRLSFARSSLWGASCLASKNSQKVAAGSGRPEQGRGPAGKRPSTDFFHSTAPCRLRSGNHLRPPDFAVLPSILAFVALGSDLELDAHHGLRISVTYAISKMLLLNWTLYFGCVE